MSYAYADAMLTWFGAAELAQIATADDASAQVDPQLLRLTISGGDRSAYGAGEIADADMAVTRIETALTEAGSLMESYLGRRYGLPLDAAVIAASNLPRTCGEIARARLYDDGGTDAVRESYREAMRFLRDIATGRAELGGADAPAGQGTGDVEVIAGTARFDENALQGF